MSDEIDDEAVEDAPLADADQRISQFEATLSEEEIEARKAMLASGDRTEEFLVELERRMICGYSYSSRRRWARMEYNVSMETVDKIEALIKRGWNLQEIDKNAFTKRDQQRQRYLYVFQRCVETDDMRNAIKALDGLSKIEGLASDTVVNNFNQTNVITSANRERIVQLMNRARELASTNRETITKGRVIEMQSLAEATKK